MGTRLGWGWYYWRSRGVANPFAHAQLIDGQGSRVKGKNPAWSSG